MSPTSLAGLAGYAISVPGLWPPVWMRTWRGDLRLLAVHETGVALIVAYWVARDRPSAVAVNAAYGLLLAGHALAARRDRS